MTTTAEHVVALRDEVDSKGGGWYRPICSCGTMAASRSNNHDDAVRLLSIFEANHRRVLATSWLPCTKCGSTTRHDDGLCYRDTRSPIFDARAGWAHTPATPDFRERVTS